MGTRYPILGAYGKPRYASNGERIQEEHREGEGAREHPPYTDGLIKRTITEGRDPAGNALDWSLPRWRMSGDDLDDLVAFLKTGPASSTLNDA